MIGRSFSLSQQCLPPRGRCVFEARRIATIIFLLTYQLQHNQAQSRAIKEDGIESLHGKKNGNTRVTTNLP